MKKKINFILFSAVILLSACSPISKDSYLERFDKFIAEVSDNCRDYTEEDWAVKTKEYDRYVGEWYGKFEDKLTTKEELHIASNQAKWFYCKSIIQGLSEIDTVINSIDTDAIKRDIQYYIDNNMKEDIQKIYDDAVKLGEEAEQAVLDILEELEIKLEELQ